MGAIEPDGLAKVGSRLRLAREANDLRLHDPALLSGISAPALSLIETGKRDLRLTGLVRIAAALRTDPCDLVGEASSRVSAQPTLSGKGYKPPSTDIGLAQAAGDVREIICQRNKSHRGKRVRRYSNYTI
jgi:transcriptional regulator with XRE-family HTH domain